MNVRRPSLRLVVTAAGAAGIAVTLALALGGGVGWPGDHPARAQFRHCGDAENLIEWEPGTLTLTPNSGFAGTSFTADVTGIPTDMETRGIEILWDWDSATPVETLIGSGAVGPEYTSATVGAVAPEDA